MTGPSGPRGPQEFPPSATACAPEKGVHAVLSCRVAQTGFPERLRWVPRPDFSLKTSEFNEITWYELDLGEWPSPPSEWSHRSRSIGAATQARRSDEARECAYDVLGTPRPFLGPCSPYAATNAARHRYMDRGGSSLAHTGFGRVDGFFLVSVGSSKRMKSRALRRLSTTSIISPNATPCMCRW